MITETFLSAGINRKVALTLALPWRTAPPTVTGKDEVVDEHLQIKPAWGEFENLLWSNIK